MPPSTLVHGFGNIHSSRDTGLGLATAGYNARLDGALSELSYYWDKDQSRIVPKAGLEYVRARTGSLLEVSGLDPVFATGATVERMRVLVGAEVGHYLYGACSRMVVVRSFQIISLSREADICAS
jgi:hypothetical protein